MKKLASLCLAVILGLTMFTSCEEKKDPIDVTKNAFLYERAWRLTGLMHTADIDAEFPVWTNLYDVMEPCRQDDYLFFHTKNSGATFDYFVKCSMSDPDSANFWYLISDNDNYFTMYTNPEDVATSIVMQGKMETPHIDTFKIVYKFYDEPSELNQQVEYTYTTFTPSDF